MKSGVPVALLYAVLSIIGASASAFAVELGSGKIPVPAEALWLTPIGGAALFAMAAVCGGAIAEHGCAQTIKRIEAHMADWKDLALHGTDQADQATRITGGVMQHIEEYRRRGHVVAADD